MQMVWTKACTLLIETNTLANTSTIASVTPEFHKTYSLYVKPTAPLFKIQKYPFWTSTDPYTEKRYAFQIDKLATEVIKCTLKLIIFFCY